MRIQTTINLNDFTDIEKKTTILQQMLRERNRMASFQMNKGSMEETKESANDGKVEILLSDIEERNERR